MAETKKPKRRKYLFPSRLAAELAYENKDKQAATNRLALNAVLFHKPAAELRCEQRSGYFLAKLYGIDRWDGGLVLVEWHAPNGQAPSLAACQHIDEWVPDVLRHLSNLTDEDSRALVELAYRVRTTANRLIADADAKEKAERDARAAAA